jgi:hypothetical protein
MTKLEADRTARLAREGVFQIRQGGVTTYIVTE